ncbi:MAG: glycine--tRNA ligase [Candidatus Blackburnbacteria bacterium RIFCSPHIGHO2_02_FULL_39_13]|uniref:glycine--tRNA ligase n=1 Tax=Candidatus Blackburnbacteria bacterium RIFCSPLOWO2_01_FULL_40_20 TaxID=1797519 RepID=A0A1G1VDQ2_9BACT|nr:MAG: Glycine-tRNA ligase [Microgenomates group bacterium GW2011_GWA2_39_19]OGY06927.1 MAG: glycine--tRNA ligase [Candidatus Blackburnbacteria bacterium RIFCSPHIGHO2_01_FULL_40_17]OGY09183.1 MAG: glycine--tRNA ligase [Candidatus Blackburnbacteria bacterium RIFCSPHIGHO2_02_FULL_39_13]OGY13580.1 MAG: glycine--tRNA ligase [Candidatus Blackburnbacteria bacterium RIFCSPLOWO2_01_FULL_40_20]HBL52232.1 glycine--tRNA ligase [Candidatus Blackburnbacteria bacterium]
MSNDGLLQKVVSLAKRRGFIFPGSEIYGGLANTYDFGPLGNALKRNLSNYWWNNFVERREDMFGLDSSILMSPKVWEASGHTASFTNIMVDCTNCHFRTRADHLIEDALLDLGNVEGKPLEELDQIIAENKIKCPNCGKVAWTKSRLFNQLFETKVGIITNDKNTAYLRGELAQGMFVNFKQILDSIHPKLPFGLAQLGKAFRNEITMGKFTFRTLEFDLAEFEYFVRPDEWEKFFDFWKEEMYKFALSLGLEEEKLRWRAHTKEELSHYSKRTEDLEYQFPWGFKEMWGLAYRTDFDLKNHMEKSGLDMRYMDQATNEKFIPHVVEPTFGISRLVTILLFNSYWEDIEKGRVVLRLPNFLAPYRVAVFPLVSNKPELVKKAREIYDNLRLRLGSVSWDDRGNIGKRYASQDEIGTPWCVTVDYQTLEDNTVTVRDRDSAEQERVGVDKLFDWFQNGLSK